MSENGNNPNSAPFYTALRFSVEGKNRTYVGQKVLKHMQVMWMVSGTTTGYLNNFITHWEHV